MALTGLPARTGFKEIVEIGTTVSYPITKPVTNPVRCSDFSIMPSQEVTVPELIQGGVDRTAFQIEQQSVGGSIGFPIVAPVGASSSVGTPPGSGFLSVDHGMDIIFSNAIENANDPSTLYSTFEVGSSYHGIFKNCMINSFGISGDQGGAVSSTVEIWPTHIDPDSQGLPNETTYYDLPEVEVVMFYNVRINEGLDIAIGTWDLDPKLIRSFNIDVANNLERNFTYNTAEYAHDITFGLRQVSGSFTFQLDNNAINNPIGGRFPRYADIMSRAGGDPSLDFEMGGGSGGTFIYTFTVNNPVFSTAEQPLTVGILEQTVNFVAVADVDKYAIEYTHI